MIPSASGRLVRSSLRYLKERLGEPAFSAALHDGSDGAARLAGIISSSDWIPLDPWMAALARFEQRHGDPSTCRLLREMTRATMAAALSTVWATFLAQASVHDLLERAPTFWSVSYNVGRLMVRERAARRARLVVEAWLNPPEAVGVSVAEACAVFLARAGHRNPRAIDARADGRLEVEVSW